MPQEFKGQTSIVTVQAPFQEQYPTSFKLHAQSEIPLTPVICWIAPKINLFFSRHSHKTLGVVTQMQDQGLSMVEIMGRNKPFTTTTFIILCLAMQVTDSKPQKIPVTEPFCAVLLTLMCPAALNNSVLT